MRSILFVLSLALLTSCADVSTIVSSNEPEMPTSKLTTDFVNKDYNVVGRVRDAHEIVEPLAELNVHRPYPSRLHWHKSICLYVFELSVAHGYVRMSPMIGMFCAITGKVV